MSDEAKESFLEALFINYEECKFARSVSACWAVKTLFINYEECKCQEKRKINFPGRALFINYEECKLLRHIEDFANISVIH